MSNQQIFYLRKGAEAMANETLAVLQPYILDTYYADNAKKLRNVVDKILFKFGGLSNKDRDDFYSLANEVFVDVIKRYDCKKSFDGFLYSCLSNKIMTEITRRNREKRKADRFSISLDGINENDEECTLLEFLPSDFDTFEEATKRQGNERYQDKVQRYISKCCREKTEAVPRRLQLYMRKVHAFPLHRR